MQKERRIKKYEFGCKVSVVTTCEEPWILSVLGHHDNPYDGATLKECLNKAEENSQAKIECAFADKSYRGKEHHPDDIKIFISGKKNSLLRFKKLLKSRPAIEPIIGHMKNDHRLGPKLFAWKAWRQNKCSFIWLCI